MDGSMGAQLTTARESAMVTGWRGPSRWLTSEARTPVRATMGQMLMHWRIRITVKEYPVGLVRIAIVVVVARPEKCLGNLASGFIGFM